MGEAAERPVGSCSLERQIWCQKKEWEEKNALVTGEVAVRRDASHPRS